MGEVNFGSKDEETSLVGAIDLKLSGQNTNILVYGDLKPKGKKKNALTLNDIVNLAITTFNKVGAKIGKTDTLPDLGIHKATFYFSPRNTVFANKLWQRGAKIDIKLNILGTLASLECDIDAGGLSATGFMSEVTLGPLKITGAGPSKKCDITHCLQSCDSKESAKSITIIKPNEGKEGITKEFELTSKNVPQALKDWTDYSKLKGPIVNIRFKPPKDIGIFASAEIDFKAGNLGTFKTDACFDISSSGFIAHFEAKIFDILESSFTLSAPDFKAPQNWQVCAGVKQNALSLLEKEVAEFVKAAKKDVSKGIDDAQNKVNSAKKAYDQAFEKAQSGIRSAQNEVNSLKRKLDDAQNKCTGQKPKGKVETKSKGKIPPRKW